MRLRVIISLLCLFTQIVLAVEPSFAGYFAFSGFGVTPEAMLDEADPACSRVMILEHQAVSVAAVRPSERISIDPPAVVPAVNDDLVTAPAPPARPADFRFVIAQPPPELAIHLRHSVLLI